MMSPAELTRRLEEHQASLESQKHLESISKSLNLLVELVAAVAVKQRGVEHDSEVDRRARDIAYKVLMEK